MSEQRIAFLGLGHMGGPMAANLVKAGFQVQGYDPFPAAQEAAKADGVEMFDSMAAAADGAGVVITMLPSGAHVLSCYAPDAGVIDAAAPGALLIDCSTIDIEDARAAHELAAAAGMRSLDAPVSGGVVGARAAGLTFMIGGTEPDLAAGTPLFEAMGRRIVHCGAAGTGQAAKVCNNLVLAVSMVAVSEAFVLAEKLGLDSKAMFDVVANSSGSCWSITSNCPVPGLVETSPANNDFQPGFAAALMRKDLLLASSAASHVGAELPATQLVTQMYVDFAEENPGLDFSAIIQEIREGSSADGTASR